jgi:hypothetical protein
MIIKQLTKLGLFKILIYFNLLDFEELSTLMVPTIAHHMKSTNKVYFVLRWPIKLNPKQQLFQFITYMKHDNMIMYDTFLWNWNNNVICNDAIYVVSYIKEVIINKIQWLLSRNGLPLICTSLSSKVVMNFLMGLSLKFVNPRTMIPTSCNSTNVRCIEWTTSWLDHCELFIYLDNNYCGSFHDVSS